MMKFVSIPYLDSGRGYPGCDCYGFARLVLKDEGIDIPEYNFTGNGNELEKGLELLEAEEKKEPGNYDIIYLASSEESEHIGVYIDGCVWQMIRTGVYSKPWKRIKGQVKGIYGIKG